MELSMTELSDIISNLNIEDCNVQLDADIIELEFKYPEEIDIRSRLNNKDVVVWVGIEVDGSVYYVDDYPSLPIHSGVSVEGVKCSIDSIQDDEHEYYLNETQKSILEKCLEKWLEFED